MTQLTFSHCSRQIIAITGTPQSPLAELADRHIFLDIPRFPPDAKVPGTLTVSLPMAAILVMLSLERGGSFEESLSLVSEQFSVAFADAHQRFARAASLIERLPKAIHVVAAPAAAAVALYGQAKLAETIGIPAIVVEPETWLHVDKHAIDELSLVVAIPQSEEDTTLYRLVALEATARDGLFLSEEADLLPAELGEDYFHVLAPQIDFTTAGDLFRRLIFFQLLALHLLHLDKVKAPFQKHRHSDEMIRGLASRSYGAAGGTHE